MRRLFRSLRLSSRILFAGSLFLVFFVIMPMCSYANWVMSVDSAGREKRVFAANHAVYVWGQLDVWDGLGFWARIYVTRDFAWSGGELLEGERGDVTRGGFNVIGSFLTGGAFFDELVWAPNPDAADPYLTPGTYDLVIDEDEDGFYNAGVDYVIGRGAGSYAFRVTAPTGPPVDLSDVKGEAGRLAKVYGEDLPNNLDLVNNLNTAGSIVGFTVDFGVKGFLFGVGLADANNKLDNFGLTIPTSYMDGVLYVYTQLVGRIGWKLWRHYSTLAADPADPDFSELAQLGAMDVYFPETDSTTEIVVVAWANRMAEQAAIIEALTRSIEKYYGAWLAYDDYYTVIQAISVKKYAEMAAASLGDVEQALSDMIAETQRLGFDKLVEVVDVTNLQQRIATSGFTAEEIQQFRESGLTSDEIAMAQEAILALDLSDMEDGTLTELLESMQTATANAIPAFQALPVQFQQVADHYSTYTQVLHPTASADGPYAGDEGAPILLDGSASTDPSGEALTYAWDLDSDGEFDDAFGAQAQWTWNSEFSGYVGLQVTNTSGLSDAAWTRVNVRSVNDGPSISVNAPAVFNPTVMPGESLVFDVIASDPDGDPLSYTWDLDGNIVSTNPTWTYTPAPADTGRKIATVTVSDGNPLSRDGVEQWRVIIKAPPEPPVADAGPEQNVLPDTDVIFDGTGSHDPDGFIATYEWDVDSSDGVSFSPPDLSGATPTLVGGHPDTGADYDVTVTLRVVDNDGLTDEDTTTVHVVSPRTITATASAGGTITPAGDVAIPYGTDKSFTMLPDAGYHLKDVLVDGASVGAAPTYTFTNVTTDHTIEAIFEIETYTITATAGVGGSIDPAGQVQVAHGADQTFAITPDPGYRVSDVLVDGTSVGIGIEGVFRNVTSDHTIEASFEVAPHTIAATAGAGGTISPSGNVGVADGGNQSFTMTPDTGYEVADVLVDGASVGARSTYTFWSVSEDHTIEASFAIDTHTITATAYSGGSITPSGSVEVDHGADQSFTITPDANYHVKDVLVDGVSVGAALSIAMTNVTTDHTVKAYFEIDTFTITATAGSGGSISPSDAVMNYGYSRTFYIRPDSHYHVVDVLVDGISVGPVTSYRFTDVTADHTIEATFAIDTYTITATAGVGGTIAPIGDVILPYGADQTFTITPDPDYYVEDVVVDGRSKGAALTYAFTDVRRDHTIEVLFARDTHVITASAGLGGSITPFGNVPVSRGGSQRFTIAADAGYHIAYVAVDGESVGVRQRYIFADVRADHTIEAIFEPGAPEPLHLTVEKSASPDQVALKGSRLVSGETSIVTLTVTGRGTPGPVRFEIDIIFALDSSGSMSNNDPTGLRKTASKDFIDYLDPSQDMVGVVSWDSSIDFSQELTNDFALAKSQIDNVNDSGGTNLNVGLSEAIRLLDIGGRSDAVHVILFLSNGSGTYSHSTAVDAANKGYVIYSIGLGSSPAEDDLRDMADTTGGKYYSAPSAAGLEAIFDDIALATTNIAGRNIVLTEVLQGHINVEGSYTEEPDEVTNNGTTTLLWNLGNISTGETWTVSFEISSSQLGLLPAQGASSVEYVNYLKNPVDEAVPQKDIATVMNAAPLADPGGPYPGITGEVVTFDGSGSSDPEGDPLTYSWDFGDGSTDTGVGPTHTYATGGTYTVTLIVRDQLGDSTPTTTTAEINTRPVANVDGPYTGNVGKEVTFDGSRSSDADGDALTYSWDFGDGSTDTGPKPKYAYSAGGTYTARLVVNDGKVDSTAATTTAVINTPPVADADGPYREKAGVAVTFDGSGSSDADGDALTYSWNFGDGNTGTGVTPVYTYTANGIYTVTLTVMDVKGNSSVATAQAVINTPPVADADGPHEAAVGEEITFDGSGSSDPDGDPLTYSWDFGDGSIGTGVDPRHTYTTGGTYTVALIVNDGKVDSDPDTTQAVVNTPPVAHPDGPYTGRIGVEMTFDGSFSHDAEDDPLTYRWDFGDGDTGAGMSPAHTYNAAGTYTVTLIVNDGKVDSASATTQAVINTPPVADANGPYAAEVGEEITFDGSGSSDADGDPLVYKWDFGDNSAGIGISPTHTYSAAGTYTVTLIVNDGKDDSAPDTAQAVINTPPVADADGPYAGSVGVELEFDGSGSSDADGDALTYSWDFGDGNTGTGVKPKHTYNAAGTHTVTLIVNDGKDDSAPSETTAEINTPPVADAGGPYTGSSGVAVELDGSGSSDADGDPLTYSWDFGDGNAGAGANPTHEYAAVGTYTVILIVNDGKIDSAPSQTTVEILNTPPVAVAKVVTEEEDRVVRFSPIEFDGSGSFDVDGDELTYLWDFGDRSTDTDMNPQHTYFIPGTYTVTLIVNDGKVDSAPGKVEVEVKQVLALLAVTYDVLNTTLALTFTDPVDPKLTDFDKIGMEVDDSGLWDFAMSNARGLRAVVDTEVPNRVIIDMRRDHPTTVNLAVAALVTHQKVDILLEPGALTGESGAKSRRVVGTDNIKVQFISNGVALGTTGDVSGDGEVTAYDAALILRSTIDGPDVFPIYPTASEVSKLLAAYGYSHDVATDTADADDDGSLSSYDASVVLRWSAGLANLAPSFGGGTKRCKLSVDSYHNGRLDVSIDLDDVSDIYSADIVMTYDPQVLTVVDASKASSTSGWLLEQGTTRSVETWQSSRDMGNSSHAVSLRISLAGAYQPVGDGSLVTLSFDVGEHGGSPLRDAIKQLDITEFKLNGGRLKAAIENLPKTFALLQNYPNPFNPETWIPYQLSEPAYVTITIYNLNGQIVRRLDLGNKMPGRYVDRSGAAYWNGRNESGERVSSGVYFYQLQAGRDASVRKMIIVK